MNNDVMSKRIPVTGSDWGFLDVRLYYSLGGYSVWHYVEEPRGYYLSVTPAKVEDRVPGVTMIASSPMDGFKTCVLTVPRKSEKAAARAMDRVDDVLPGLIDAVCSRIGAKVA